ncbi:MAG: transposase, partial [Planctomycetia bacterium]
MVQACGPARRRGRKSTRPGANGVVDLSPFEFLDPLADLVPPPRKHRHRYHGVFAPNHKLRKAVTALAIGNIGKPREATKGGHGNDGHATGGCCDAHQKPRSHRPEARPPTGASSSRPLTSATSFKPCPTNARDRHPQPLTGAG